MVQPDAAQLLLEALVSRPTVSRLLQQLRHKLGDALQARRNGAAEQDLAQRIDQNLVRITPGVSLTPAACMAVTRISTRVHTRRPALRDFFLILEVDPFLTNNIC
jgi:hypothetical protein